MAKKKTPHKVVHRKLGKEQAWGQADIEKNTIEIDERLTGYRYFLICIHEQQHLLHPDWSETKVRRISSKIARFLWDLGFRWVDQSKK